MESRRRGRPAGNPSSFPIRYSPLLLAGPCFRLELLLEGRQLGEGRVRVRLLVTSVLARALSLDEGGAQLRVAVGTVAVAVAPAVMVTFAIGTAALGREPLLRHSLL